MIKGIGIDIIEISRIKNLIYEKGDRALSRLFTEGEVEYCTSKADPFPSYAGRFAAKEAFLKALGTGLRGIKWTEMEILSDDKGKPLMNLSGNASKKLKELEATEIYLSISHSKEYAVAQVMLV